MGSELSMHLLLDGDCVYAEAAEFHIVTWVTAGTVLGSAPWLSEVPRGRVLSSDPQVLVGLHWERWLSQLLNHLMCGTNQNLVPTCSHLVRVDKDLSRLEHPEPLQILGLQC